MRYQHICSAVAISALAGGGCAVDPDSAPSPASAARSGDAGPIDPAEVEPTASTAQELAGACSTAEATATLATRTIDVAFSPDLEEEDRSGGYAEVVFDRYVDTHTRIQLRTYTLPNSRGGPVSLTLSRRELDPATGRWNIVWKKYIERGAAPGINDESSVQSNGVVEVDASGDIYVAGHSFGTARFDETVIRGPLKWDAFLSRWSADGELRWVKTFGFQHRTNDIAGSVLSTSIAIDPAGNPVVLGQMYDVYAGTVELGTSPSGAPVSIPPVGSDETFLARFDAATGAPLWAKSLARSVKTASIYRGSQLGVYPGAVQIDAAGNIAVTGGFAQSANFEDARVNGAVGDMAVGNSYGGAYVFFASYDLDGSLRAVKRIGERESMARLLFPFERAASGRLYYEAEVSDNGDGRFKTGGSQITGHKRFWLCVPPTGAAVVGLLP